MQRSLLPRAAPEIPGLELGDVYESAARLEVGGDVYDYLTLGDGRLAVVLGDVTGHGVDATADMAMAKYVFRSLAREHVVPGDFLAAANEVVSSEIASGRFITMVELVIDAAKGEVACASGGHPQPRLVLPDGTVECIAAHGLALGIDAPQVYETVTRPSLRARSSSCTQMGSSRHGAAGSSSGSSGWTRCSRSTERCRRRRWRRPHCRVPGLVGKRG